MGVRTRLLRLCNLYKIPLDIRPVLTVKKLRKRSAFYRPSKREIVLDQEVAGTKIAGKVLRHEFAHYLQHIGNRRFVEKEATRFECNIKSNVPFPVPRKRSDEQTELDLWL